MSDKDPSKLRPNRPKLALHVPEPPFRPGDTPDFSSLKIPAAGAAPRPDVAAPATETHPLTTHLVRVLGDDHQAVGPWDPKLDPDTLRKMLRDMVTVRIFDDRMYRAQRQGKTSFYMKCTGEEAIAVAAAAALDREDMHFPSYRQQGLLVARGYPLIEMMCQIYSNKGDKLQGRQLPVMYSDKAHGFFSISGNLVSPAQAWLEWCGTAVAALTMTYTLTAGLAVRLRRRNVSSRSANLPPVTVLKPLCGAERDLYQCLRSFCEQAYESYPGIRCTRVGRSCSHCGAQTATRVYKELDLQLAVNTAQHGSSGKVSNLINMMPYAPARLSCPCGQRH